MSGLEDIVNEAEIALITNRDFTGLPLKPFVMKVGGDAICIPGSYQYSIGNVKIFPIRNEDVFVMGYAKTGTTWCQEMVWLIVNNLDYEGAKTDIYKRSPVLEYPTSFTDSIEGTNWMSAASKCIEKMENPRVIKCHLPWFLLPDEIRNDSKQPKIVYMLRNPKDCCVSYYHYLKYLRRYSGSFEDFCKLVLAGREPYGSFWKSVLSFWQQKHRSNILFLDYKEMKASLPCVIKKVANFLGKPITEQQVAILADHLSFENMKNNPAVNHHSLVKKYDEHGNLAAKDNSSFMRCGKVGGHKSLMTPEWIEKFNAWTKHNIAGTDFSIHSLLE